jgi:hypothetical protein
VPNDQQAAIATPLCDDGDSTICFTASTYLVTSQPEAILVFLLLPNHSNDLSEVYSLKVVPDAIHQCLYTLVHPARAHTLKSAPLSTLKIFLSLSYVT